MMINDTPESVEEAGALLGAAITKCNVTSLPSVKPPKGMHSSFATMSPVPSSELFCRLYQLRDLLRRAPRNEPLIAAPSILAVLMKLLGVSSSLAPQFIQDGRVNTPPLWSTPLRTLWVDSVVLCHVLGDSLTGKTRIDIYAFVKNMVALAGLNPKSQKAAGGTRMAALQVIAGLFLQLPQKLSPWALDVLCLCTKSLKSSGAGEPSYRIASVQTAVAVAQACRQARSQMQQQQGLESSSPLLYPGAMEDRALQESLRLIKQAVTDKYPEVREAAAHFCAALAPLLVLPIRPADKLEATVNLEEAIQLAFRNLDDECHAVSIAWADAMSCCLTTSIAHGQQLVETFPRRKDADDDNIGDDSAPEVLRYTASKTAKNMSIVTSCKSLPLTVNYLVDQFIKVGGELSAARLGGPFSTGGRAVRVGIGLVLMKLVSFFSSTSLAIGIEYPVKNVLIDVLAMVGPELEKQLGGSDARPALLTPKGQGGFGFGAKVKSSADGCLARLAAGRVLRCGLCEIASEAMQLSILTELTALCGNVTEPLRTPLNPQQLQVALVEISHILATLGEAAGSVLEELSPVLMNSLKHPSLGVRHESAVACAAIATAFPRLGKKMFTQSLAEIQVQHAELVTQATIDESEKPIMASPKKLSRFGVKSGESPSLDKSSHFLYAIHGHSLMISLLLKEITSLPGGLPIDLLSNAMSVGEILVTCQFIDILTKVNPSGACSCARAGYGIICGALKVGARPIQKHIRLLFGLWQRSLSSIENGGKNFTADQDLICLEAVLLSIVSFLEHCSELLLMEPDALFQTTITLEHLLPLFMPNGRLELPPIGLGAESRHQIAKACLMEAFAWLPPGSFPTVANEVFSFAMQHIQSATENEVMSSLLPSLVNNEDKVLDAKSICRVQRFGQIGGGREIDYNCIVVDSEVSHHVERESVMHLQGSPVRNKLKTHHQMLWCSHILGSQAYDGIDLAPPPPTPLHEVGTWRKPVSPSYSSKVRLVDAAVQAFAATFGLKDGKEQQYAMKVLEQMVPPFLGQLARAVGVNVSLVEDQRRNKTKSDDVAAIANITAVLLACLKSLPLHESTHDIPIGLGPPWMNKAKDLLLTLLPSTSNIVRRAAAEGLALLATLGVSEDAHTLQSTVLHSLDEVMQGNKPDGKPRAIPLEPISAARAGSLLTLGCIQRTAHNIKLIQMARSKGRSTTSESITAAQEHALPTMQMMTRVLPSIACHASIRDAFTPRLYGIHAFNILLSYATFQKTDEWNAEDHHLIKKAIESVIDNFLSFWTAVSTDMDGEQAPEKLSGEVPFLSVILRMMTCLLPHLDDSTASRFLEISCVIIEGCGRHPVVLVETLVFLEVFVQQERLQHNTTLTEIAGRVIDMVLPKTPTDFRTGSAVASSPQCVEAAVMYISAFGRVSTGAETDLSSVMRLLDKTTGARPCTSDTLFRGLAAPREVNEILRNHLRIEYTIVQALGAQTGQLAQVTPFTSSQQRWQVRAAAIAFVCEEVKQKQELSQGSLSELLVSACAAVVATLEAQELRQVQEVGAKLLTILISLFGDTPDASAPDSKLMEQYSSQLLASVKHSITLTGTDDDEEAYSLFVHGCSALVELIKGSLLSEASSFKRLVRPVIPSAKEVGFTKLNANAVENPFRGKVITPHVAKLETLSQLRVLVDDGSVKADCASVLREFTLEANAGLAIHCAAVALDGWRLSRGIKEAGFFFGNALDLDAREKSLIIQGGPPCLCNAMISLVQIVEDASIAEEMRESCMVWLETCIPLSLVSFFDSVKTISGCTNGSMGQTVGILPPISTLFHLHALRSLINFKSDVNTTTSAIVEVASEVSTAILMPFLGFEQTNANGADQHSPSRVDNKCLIEEACTFIEKVAASTSNTPEIDSKILVILLTPLDAVQRQRVSLDHTFVTTITISSMKAMASVVQKRAASASVVNAMVQFSIELLSTEDGNRLRDIAEHVLDVCLSHSAVAVSRKESLAVDMAKDGNWKVWATICAQCPEAMSKSLPVANHALADLQDNVGHIGALTGIRRILQGFQVTASPMVGQVLRVTGGSCMTLYKAYGTNAVPIKDLETNRIAVSADVLKIIMIAYQSLSGGDNQLLVSFLSVIFDLFIDVIQFNGLPNQASLQVGANPMLGRLAAHTIVHVARTTPVAFKEAVAGLMSSHGRAILEFAVRAEMSGYAVVAGIAPPKKKLNLKSFQR